MSGPGNAGGLAPYRISKAGVNALVRNLAHETNHGTRGLLVDAICPNHTRTDMGGPDAPLSVEEGADTAVWLATRTFDPAVDKTGFSLGRAADYRVVVTLDIPARMSRSLRRRAAQAESPRCKTFLTT